jgi:hypothetical protein
MGLFFERGPGLILDLGATQAAVHVAVGAAFAIISNFDGGTMQSATGIAPAIVDIDPLTVVIFAVIAAAGVVGYAYPANTFSGAAAGSVTFLTDASAPFNPQFLLIGGQNYQPFDKAAGVIYDDTLALPPLGAANVQSAIDALKAKTGGGVYTPVLAPSVNVLGSIVYPEFLYGWSYSVAPNGTVMLSGRIEITAAGIGLVSFDLNIPFGGAFPAAGNYAHGVMTGADPARPDLTNLGRVTPVPGAARIRCSYYNPYLTPAPGSTQEFQIVVQYESF